MGAWGTGRFDNDDAMDWVVELKGAEGTEPLAEAFEAVFEVGDESLDVTEAFAGLAAAEVVAALLGRPPADLPDEVAAWAAGRKRPPAGLVKTAQRVVRRVLADTDFKEIWSEAEDAAAWQREVEGLLARLGGGPAAAGA